MDRNDVNQMIARAAGVDTETTEQVLVGLEKVILEEVQGGGMGKVSNVVNLYKIWKSV